MDLDIEKFKEERRRIKLQRSARDLSRFDIKSMKTKLKSDKSNLELRFQLFSYYSEWTDRRRLKHKGAQRRLYEITSWLIDNHPALDDSFGYEIQGSNCYFSNNRFARLRHKWLKQVNSFPNNPTVLGNAARFLSYRDSQTACDLFERAYALDPNQRWLESLVNNLANSSCLAPNKFDRETCRRVIDAGLRSLQTEALPEHSTICCEIADAAWVLEDYETVKICAEKLLEPYRAKTQVGHAYMGLLALRDNNREEAIARLLTPPRVGPYPQRMLLARELFHQGERDSIITFIKEWCPEIGQKTKQHWLTQAANGVVPDFENRFK